MYMYYKQDILTVKSVGQSEGALYKIISSAYGPI